MLGLIISYMLISSPISAQEQYFEPDFDVLQTVQDADPDQDDAAAPGDDAGSDDAAVPDDYAPADDAAAPDDDAGSDDAAAPGDDAGSDDAAALGDDAGSDDAAAPDDDVPDSDQDAAAPDQNDAAAPAVQEEPPAPKQQKEVVREYQQVTIYQSVPVQSDSADADPVIDMTETNVLLTYILSFLAFFTLVLICKFTYKFFRIFI